MISSIQIKLLPENIRRKLLNATIDMVLEDKAKARIEDGSTIIDLARDDIESADTRIKIIAERGVVSTTTTTNKIIKACG